MRHNGLLMIAQCLARGVAVCCFVVGLVACGNDDEDPEVFATLAPDASFPGAPGDPARFDSLFAFEPLEGCSVPNPTDLQGDTELRVFRGRGVPDRDLDDFLGGLARYYSQYGVSMFTRHEVIDVPIAHAMIFDMNALGDRVEQETGIDPRRSAEDLSQEELDRVTGALGRGIFHNVRELVRVYGTPRANVVNVAILESMVGDDLPSELAAFRGLAGVGLSPELLMAISEDDPSITLYEWLDLGDQFTPIAIVGTDVVKQHLTHPDIVIAHEVGHAYGLVHVDASDNLLHQGATECTLSLDADQLARVGIATGAAAHVLGVEALSLTKRAGELVQALRAFARSGFP